MLNLVWLKSSITLVQNRRFQTAAKNPGNVSQLTRGDLDIVVMEWWNPKPGFEARDWKQELVVVIVSPDHPCARLSEIDRETLAGMTLLGAEPGTGRLLATFFGDNGHFPEVSM
jgi:DNA-binding transcriptional LysR family regulator